MSYLQSEKVVNAKIGFDTRFNAMIDSLRKDELALYKRLAVEINSETPTIEHHWLGTLPTLSKFVDQRKISKMRGEKFVVTSEGLG
jgi:phage major head subunit gpT-like protein